jgi:membrane protein DedA with SNARE-associated domain
MVGSAEDLVTASAITYLVIVGFVWLDAWFPVVPGETLVLTGAVLAAQGKLSLWLVVLAGLAGAIAGDNFTYLLGAKLGTRAAGKLFRTDKSRGRLAWAEDQLERRRWIILVSRFVAGGRTAVMFASGTFQMEWRTRFLPFQVAAALLWTGAMALLGYLFGSTFQDSVWLPLLASLPIAAAITGIAQLVVRRRAGDACDGAISRVTSRYTSRHCEPAGR